MISHQQHDGSTNVILSGSEESRIFSHLRKADPSAIASG
jgi:hypothetical protein